VKNLPAAALAAITVLLASCTSGSNAPAGQAVAEGTICEVSEWQRDSVAEACTPGQKVVFLPGSFGNEQLPIYFAAVNCDLHYSVALTTGAVTCIYGPITLNDAP